MKEKQKQMSDEFTAQAEDTWVERMEIRLVKGIGSWWFLLVNLIWFAIWIVGDYNFEKLTFWVSLEAIVLAVLILINENKELKHDRERAIKDYKIDLSMAKKIKSLEKQMEKLLAKLDKMS